MNKKMNKLFIYSLLLSSFLLSCHKDNVIEITPDPPVAPPVEQKISPEVALRWSQISLNVIKNAPDNSPTYTSRSLGYIGLTMYESVVAGSIIYQSIAPQLNGLGKLPEANKLDWEVALSAGQKEIILDLYPHIRDFSKNEMLAYYDSLITQKKTAGVSDSLILASETYGQLIGQSIFEWSKTDKGFEAYKNTFDRQYKYPTGAQYWKPPTVGQSSVAAPMHPHWGENRNFLIQNAENAVPEMISYSTDTASGYYKEMNIVYLKNKNLSQAEKESALWWGDDPAVSASPPGHSYYLGQVMVKKHETNLFEATSVFAKVGMAVADAFINTWRCKFKYHTQRPTSFINANIDRNYSQFWPEPPFPAFISGHSTQIASAVTVLINHYGNEQEFVDDFHLGRPKDFSRNVEFKSRSYTKLWDLAEECGWSRILGGIHIPSDNTKGLEEGKKIGSNISSLKWIKIVGFQ